MDDNKTQKEETMEEAQKPVGTTEATAVEEKVEKIEAPEKIEELEAPNKKEIETKEEEGQPSEDVKVEEPKEAEKLSEAKSPSEVSPSPSDNAKWYIVHTYSGHENKVSKSLRQRIESMGFEDRIFDIIVPTRETVKVSQGKKETVKEKIFPGYVLVKMILDDESWLLVRTTQGVTAFIGAGNKPTPISDKEVEAIQKFMATEEPLYKTSFSVGEAVKIVDGPFTDFLGTIDNIDEAKGKLKVLVSIFGRETPVELDFLQVSKL
jgi:transcription termination/antitermination protein NusG